MASIVYKTVNNINGKFCYGVCSTGRKDYLGGGNTLRKAVKKYGKENFTRYTVADNLTSDEAFELEELIVDSEMILDKKCYNEKVGGLGGRNMSQLQKDAISKSLKGRNNNKVDYLDLATGIFYTTIEEVAELLSAKHRTVRSWLDGQCPNKSTVIRIKD